jgi:hypothetical protein
VAATQERSARPRAVWAVGSPAADLVINRGPLAQRLSAPG